MRNTSAQSTDAAKRAMTCIQDMPFLRIERVGRDVGRQARVTRVGVVVEQHLPKLVVELGDVDEHDDDDPGSPPCVAADAPEPHRQFLRAEAARPSSPPVFLPSPIDSMREPPMSLTKLVSDLLAPLTTTFTKLLVPQLQTA